MNNPQPCFCYSSLGTTVANGNDNQLLNDSCVKDIAEKHDKTPAQVSIWWQRSWKLDHFTSFLMIILFIYKTVKLFGSVTI